MSWKGYPKEENTWEPASAIQHLRRFVCTFHKEHPEKPTATSPPVDSAPPIAKPTVKAHLKLSATKQKRCRPAKTCGANKGAKNSWTPLKTLQSSAAFPPSSAFQFFFLLVFPPKPSARPGGFFYQAFLNFSSSAHPSGLGARARPFRFSSTSPAKVWRFFHRLALQVFLHHFPLRFWRFFI